MDKGSRRIQMRKLLVSLMMILLFASCASAQTAAWNQDYKKALAESRKTGKPILIDFAGSDWCVWCIRLEKEVFSQAAFRRYAKKNLVLMLADFPNKKEQTAGIKAQNNELAKKFSIEGFPTVVLLNSKGETLGVTGYLDGGAEKYVKHLKDIIAAKK
jgi:protein disulfide-isomerase